MSNESKETEDFGQLIYVMLKICYHAFILLNHFKRHFFIQSLTVNLNVNNYTFQVHFL